MDRRVMVILAEGFEEGETTTIIDVLRRAGFETHAVSLTGELVTGAHGMRLMADRILDSEGFRDYDMIVLPGGWGAADNMAADSRLTELLRWYAASRKSMWQPCVLLRGYWQRRDHRPERR